MATTRLKNISGHSVDKAFLLKHMKFKQIYSKIDFFGFIFREFWYFAVMELNVRVGVLRGAVCTSSHNIYLGKQDKISIASKLLKNTISCQDFIPKSSLTT